MTRANLRTLRASSLLAIAGACLALSGCANDDAQQVAADPNQPQRSALMDGRLPGSGFLLDPTGAVRSPDAELRGVDRQLAERQRVSPQDITPTRPGSTAGSSVAVGTLPIQRDLDVTLNFKAAPMGEVLREIFENILQVDYAISPQIKDDAMSFLLEGRIGYEELFRTLDSVLRMYGASLQVSGGLVQVLPTDQAKRGVAGPLVRSIDESSPTPLTTATYVVPLTNIRPADAKKTLEPLLTERGQIIEGPTNTSLIVMVESPDNAPRLVQLLRELDQPFFARRTLRLYTPVHISAADLATEMTAFVTRLGVTTGAQDAQFAAAALPRSGQVFVATTLPSIIPDIDNWFGRLDVALDSEQTRRYVYRAQQLDAETLSQAVLSSFADLGDDAPSIVVVNSGGASGGLSSLSESGPAPAPAQQTGRAQTGGTQGTQQRQSSFGSSSRGSLSATGDKGQMIIRAKPDVYREVRELLDVLDGPPRQVYLQVVIAEVTISGDVQFGVELFTQQGLGDYDVELRSANNLVEAATGSFFILGKNAFALVEAAQSKGDVRVLDAPYIFTVSGQAANLEVGVDQPIITQFIRGGVDAVDPTRQSNQVEYRQTGVVLNVTAVVNDRAEVILDVRQEVSSVEQPTATAAIQSPAFPNRILQTRVVVPNGRTVVLGGTRNERDSLRRNKTPLLAEIPLLGLAFQGKDVQRQQSELVVLITPTIVIQPADAVLMSQEILSSVVNIGRIDSLLAPQEIDENDLLWR